VEAASTLSVLSASPPPEPSPYLLLILGDSVLDLTSALLRQRQGGALLVGHSFMHDSFLLTDRLVVHAVLAGAELEPGAITSPLMTSHQQSGRLVFHRDAQPLHLLDSFPTPVRFPQVIMSVLFDPETDSFMLEALAQLLASVAQVMETGGVLRVLLSRHEPALFERLKACGSAAGLDCEGRQEVTAWCHDGGDDDLHAFHEGSVFVFRKAHAGWSAGP
jgi:hypothetical protein